MARFTPSLHPRGHHGKFIKKGSASAPKKRSSGTINIKPATAKKINKNIKNVQAANQVRNDVVRTYTHAGLAAGHAGTGNYVLAGLHGAKAGTSASRVASAGVRLQTKNTKKLTAGQKQARLVKLDKFDRNVKRIDTAANIGLGISYGANLLAKKGAVGYVQKRAGSKNAARAAKASTGGRVTLNSGLKAAKSNRAGVYKITSMTGSKIGR